MLIYWSIKINPITGYDEEGEPERMLGFYVVMLMMLGCYIVLNLYREKRRLEKAENLLEKFERRINGETENLSDWDLESDSLIKYTREYAVNIYRKYIPSDSVDRSGLKEILKKINLAIENNSNAIKLLDVKGQLYMMMGEYESARDIYRKILVRSPDYLNAYLKIIEIYQRSEKSISQLFEDAKIESSHLYDKYIDATDLPASLNKVRMLLRKNKTIELLDVKGEIHILMGKFSSAADIYWGILHEDKNYINAYMKIIESYEEEKLERMFKSDSK